MLRNTFRALVAFSVVGVTLAAADSAQAFHGRHRGWGSSGGSWGSYGSYGSSGSWGSSGGRWGSHGSSGGWYGSSGSSGSSGGWYYGSSGSSGGSWGSSGGSWGSSGGSSGGYVPSAPTAPAPPAPGDAAPPAPNVPAPTDPAAGYHPTYGPMRSSAFVTVKVPADAKVFVNDRPTTSTGTDREYVSHDLTPGARYNYNIRAEFERDGKTVSETKSVQLAAGQTASLDFIGEAQVQTADNTDTRTTLIVRLPADAKLFLAGHETKATGEVREFSTTKLPNGGQWQKYEIKAVVDRDGRQEVREQSIELAAGESREVTISFDSVASDNVAQTASR